MQINERAGLTFAVGLRSVLRQDPDVVLVGEVRDVETAELALQASLTGHLVLTTLHTNDAVSAITRLVDMGVEPFLVASSLTLGRRPTAGPPAVRRLRRAVHAGRQRAGPARPRARTTWPTPPRCAAAAAASAAAPATAAGSAIFEVLPVTSGLRAVLLRDPDRERAVRRCPRRRDDDAARRRHREGRAGETTFEEVLRVSQVDVTSGRRCPSCDRGLADDMVVCPWCATHVDRGHCEQCARPLEAGWRICPWCRTAAPPPITPLEHRPSLPRVLHVGADDEARQAFADALHGLVLFDEAESADEAMAQVSDAVFDAVLISANLPDLTGVELVRLLRTDPRTAGLPLMMVGTDTDDTVAGEALKAGADEFLALPALPLLIEERVVALTDRSPRFSGPNTIAW